MGKKCLCFCFIAVAMTFTASLGDTGKICDAYYTLRPETFNTQTIFLPQEAVSLSPRIYVGDSSMVVESLLVKDDPPSIFFIIDNSPSMFETDPQGSRFTVTRDLIDKIYERFPTAEVGLAVFTEYLEFDCTNLPYAQALTGESPHGFLPLMQLDKVISGGQTGYQLLKNILVTVDDPMQGTTLVYRPQAFFNSVGTNINCGFDAAKQAYLAAQYSKDRQCIIFLSDGEANRPFGGDPNAYTAATNVPATFSVFFTSSGILPPTLVRFTDNVRTNNYSAFNPKSNLWPIATSHDTLLNLLNDNVISVLMRNWHAVPTNLKVNGKTSTTYVDSLFVFQDRFPLTGDLGDINSFSFNLDYAISLDSVALSYQNVKINFDIVRRPNVTLPEGWELDCWNRELQFYYNGKPITAADETMSQIEVRFTHDNTDGAYPTVAIELRNTDPQHRDREDVALTQKNNYWTVTMDRVISNSSVINDKILQHSSTDSLVAVFRNPKLPLDTLRECIPFFVKSSISLLNATYFDSDANGFIDSIFIALQGTVNTADLDELFDLIVLPSRRGFQLQRSNSRTVNGGVALIVKENGSSGPRTAVDSTDMISINTGLLPTSGRVEAGNVIAIDSVAPVIINAAVVDHEVDSIDDTLRVKFSEPMAAINGNQPFRFLFLRNGSTYIPVLSFRNSAANNTEFIFTVQSLSGGTFHGGDSIWINTTAGVKDQPHNIQDNPDNVRRALAYQFISQPKAKLLSAKTRDLDGDGYLDAIELSFERTIRVPNNPDLNAIDVTFRDVKFRVIGMLPSGGDSAAVLMLKLAENTTDYPDQLQTAWRPTISITGLSEAADAVKDIQCEDGAGPVVHHATLFSAVSPNHGDTLRVELSEPVSVMQLRAADVASAFFIYSGDRGHCPQALEDANYAWTSDGPYSSVIFIVAAAANDENDAIVPGRDSVQLVAYTSDESANQPPDSTKARKAAIKAGGINKISIVVVPNPFRPNKSIFDQRVLDKYRNVIPDGGVGVLIVITAKIPLLPDEEGNFGSAVIYDAVGNAIAKNLEVKQAQDFRHYGIFWDLKNRNRRLVGSGTYVGIVSLASGDGVKIVAQTKIGVDR